MGQVFSSREQDPYLDKKENDFLTKKTVALIYLRTITGWIFFLINGHISGNIS